MSAENKATVRRAFERIWSQGDFEEIYQIFDTNYLFRDAATPDKVTHGPLGLQRLVALYRAAFPDLSFIVEDQVAEGKTVVTRWTMTGAFRGGFRGYAPTGWPFKVTGFSFDRFTGSRIDATLVNWDFLGMLQQTNALPFPMGAAGV